MADRILIKGGHVISMDSEVGDHSPGDVLIEDDEIAQVGASIEAGDAEVIDASGDIVIPGFIDSHRHTWETAIRNCAPNATLDDYFVEVLDSFAPLYRPEDVYASNLWGSLECINAGITTVVDWSHINNTPEHPDAAINGLRETGIRAQYAYGSANTSLAAYWFESELAVPADDVKRVHDSLSGDDMISMALATRGPGFCMTDVVEAEWELAKDLGIPVTVHVGMGRMAGRFGMVKQLSDADLLYEGTTYIHSCYLNDEEWQMVMDSGGHISIAAQVEMQMGHGTPPTIQCRNHGIKASLSNDVVTTVPGDMFTQMRAAFGNERLLTLNETWVENVDPPDTLLPAREVLEMGTINGAAVANLDGVTGSLTPGKKADVVIIDGGAPNVAPIIDPVGAVVISADVSNVDTVIIDGKVKKRDGRLVDVDLDRARSLIESSKDYLVSELEKKQAEMPGDEV
jgi:5-methylthioadenosine/S-adenosylhomocysteine deaminase